MHELLEHAMRSLPSQGRGSGWVSRRNRALLVLTELAGLSGADITKLTAGDVTVIDGTAIISTARGPVTVDSVEDNVLCGPCALVRWLRTLEMAAIYPDQRVPTAVITRGAPLASDSPHACRGGNPVNPRIRHAPLLPVIDQWGLVPIRWNDHRPAAGHHGPGRDPLAAQLEHITMLLLGTAVPETGENRT